VSGNTVTGTGVGSVVVTSPITATPFSVGGVASVKSVKVYTYSNTATVNISSPLSGALYSVYSAATGGTLITTGNGSTPFIFPSITTDTSFYIECVSASGCVSIDRKKVKVTATQFPIATATQASITTCIGTSATFNVASPVTNAVYTWYDAATGGNVVGSGNALTISPVTVDATYYLETSLNGCVSVNRFPVALTAATTPSLAVVSNAVTVCSGDPANFAIASPDATVTYNWYTASTGGTATTGTTYSINPATTSASYYVSATSVNGCTTSPRLKVDLTVTQRPVVSVVAPSDVSVCKGTTQVFTVQNPVTGAVYNWYNAASSGTPLQANSITFTTPAVNAPATYYVDGTSNGCTSISRATVKVSPLDVLAPVVFVTVDSTKTNEITFGWSPVTGAVSYAISIDGAGYVSPNNIPTSLNHTLQNLAPGERHKATVMAIGANVCQNSISDTAYGKTVQNSTYYPNSFTPNGDGKNDKIVICGSSIKELRYAVFNQFGEKIWETTTANIDAKGCYTLWDGTQRGVPQPTGVYMYASRIVFLDGKVEEKNGSINLVR
jgi:gliding motility-associated-like protein